MKKAQEKKIKVASDLLKLKVTTHGVKALMKEKKEIKLKEWENLFNKVKKVSLSTEKGKAKRTRSEEV